MKLLLNPLHFKSNSMKTIIALFVSSLFVTTLTAQRNVSEDQLMQELIDNKHVGVVAAYSIDGNTQWKGEFGVRNCDSKEPFTLTTFTRVASLAKPMTAIAIMQLVEAGTLDLDAPITDYLADYPVKANQVITTRQLLAHTSGIDGYANSKEAQNTVDYPQLSDALSIFKNRDLLFDPGTQFNYTSYGYVVLGVIIERISGLSYADYMKTNIWDKAGMTNTSIEKQGMSYENRSLLYHKKKRKAKLADQNNLSNRTPGGGFSTTAADIMAFGQAVVKHTLISEETSKTMMEISYQPEEGNPYGLGFQLYGSKGTENVLIGHGGAQTGTNSQLFIDRSRNIVVVCISNTSGTGSDSILTALELYLKAQAIADADK